MTRELSPRQTAGTMLKTYGLEAPEQAASIADACAKTGTGEDRDYWVEVMIQAKTMIGVEQSC